jgi:hypothetical protein
MATIHFSLEEMKPLMDHARSCTEWGATYAGPATGPGLWLVGDHGIYLMSNGKPHQHQPGAASPDSSLVVYAEECNPDTDPDGWWDAKVSYYGGDDGSDTIDLKDIDSLLQTAKELGVTPKRFAINIRPSNFKLGLV